MTLPLTNKQTLDNESIINQNEQMLTGQAIRDWLNAILHRSRQYFNQLNALPLKDAVFQPMKTSQCQVNECKPASID